MRVIANQFWIVLREIGRLFWIILREIGLLLGRGGQYVYAHRRQIARHRATPWVLVGVAAAWSVWGMYRHLQPRPHADEKPVPVVPVAYRTENDFQQQYYQLTQQYPAPDASKALTQSVHSWLGVPHRDNGSDRTGTDCSAFVHNVYLEAYGLTLTRNSRTMYDLDVNPIERDELREGDLVFFDTFKTGDITHVGIYLSNGRFAHASSRRGVTVDSLTNPFYDKSYYASGRVKR